MAAKDLEYLSHLDVNAETGIWLLLLMALVLLLRVVYNIYLHPLSSFPGPKYLAASDLPISVLQLRGTSHNTLRGLHEKYGDVVRVGPRILSFVNSMAWDDIYGFRNGRCALPKDPQFYNDMLLPDITITRAGDQEGIPIRRAMSSAFSQKALMEQEPMIQSHIQRLLAQLRKASHANSAVDVRKWFIFSMFDITSDFGFGEDMGCVANGKFHEWVEFVFVFFYAATFLHQCYKFAPLNKLLALCVPKSIKERQRKHHEASLMRVRRRMSKETAHPDFMHYFLRSAEKKGLTMPVIEAQASVLVLAGSESTAVAITGAVYYILSNPTVHEKLRKEIRDTFPTCADIQLRAVQSKLPYLDAVVQETMRIHPPFANGFPRVVEDKNGAVICGKWVPKGTAVSINHYCCGTSSQNFIDPFAFVPERWLGDPKYTNDKRDAVQPFLVGPRNCLGRMFALNNMKLLLTHIIWNFDMELDEGVEDWNVGQKVYNGWIQPELLVRLHERA